MKTPISYYGGKQSMLQDILPLIPKHNAYCEPFCGGAAIFFAKKPSKIECINDASGNVVNFYEQLKTNFDALKRLIDATPYSRDVFYRARVVYKSPLIFDKIERAWAFWVVTNQGFNYSTESWRSNSFKKNEALSNFNKKKLFTREISTRLDMVQIENKDACELIGDMDCSETFFYIDPPYVNANQGHYEGYTQQHFNALLTTISEIKGKFLLSSYPNKELENYTKKNNWWTKEINKPLTASSSKKWKIEVLTGNYDIYSTTIFPL